MLRCGFVVRIYGGCASEDDVNPYITQLQEVATNMHLSRSMKMDGVQVQYVHKEYDGPLYEIETRTMPRQNEDQEEGEAVGIQGQTRKDVASDAHESTCSGHFKKSNGMRMGGSILQCIEDLVHVGQTMGYDMTGCMKNMEEIIESQGVTGGYR
ncbi:hypothetical protein Tco_0600392 [Tanacetum coccineum]|uniref:Uncharacterized protein n=1 Tax=Tanacetum coccineum TaxID=301880 RepID=A0ABQ4WBK5_9ASTR